MDPQLWKLAGVVIYLGCLLAIGFAASRRMNSVKDYFAGGKNMGFLSVAFSARATGESAWLLLGLTGMGAAVGVRGFWVVLGEVLGVTGAWLLLARPFKRLTDRYDSITVPDYLASRFADNSHTLRRIAAGSLLVFVTIYVAAQIFATGQAFQTFLGWNYYVGIAVGFAVVLVYATSGGFVAVVWSDVFQGTLMFLGLVGLPAYGMWFIGGPLPLIDKLYDIDPSLLSMAGAEGWTLHSGLGTLALALIGLGFLGSPQIFVRFVALRSEHEITRGAAVAFIWTLLADSGAVLTGLLGRALLTSPGQVIGPEAQGGVLGANAEAVLPELVLFLLHPAMVGLLIAIVLSAIMSTADSLLVLAASAIVRDWYQQVRHPELPDEALVGLSRKATVAVAAVALLVAMVATSPTQTVFWFVIFGWSGIAATFCPTLVLSLFWRGMTARGAVAGMVTGFLAVPIFKFAVPHLPLIGSTIAALEELPPAFVLSGLAAVVVSQLDPVGQAALRDVEL